MPGTAGVAPVFGGRALSLEINIAPATIAQPISNAPITMTGDVLSFFSPQHCLYFIPLPQVQGLFRPVFIVIPCYPHDLEQKLPCRYRARVPFRIGSIVLAVNL